MPLKFGVGDTFPESQLTDQTGAPVFLDELLGKGPLFLAFYRGYW